MSEKGVARRRESHGVADVGSVRVCRHQLFARVPFPATVADIAELTRSTRPTEDDDLEAFEAVGFDQVRLPAARVRIRTSPTLDTDEPTRSHESMIARVSEPD